MKKNKFTVLELFILFSKPQRLGANRKMFGLRTIFSTKLCQDLSKHRTTQHGSREVGQERVTMCCQEDTVCFSPVIDRQIVSAVIVRGLCDVWRNMNSATFVRLPCEFIVFL